MTDALHPGSPYAARRSTHQALHRWPTVVGLVAASAALLAAADRDTAATSVGVAVLCYLGAAALNRPWVAWAGVLGGSVVVTAGELAGIGRWAALGAVALALVVVAVVVGAPRRPMIAQTVAFAAYGGLAFGALALDPRPGLVLAGLTLAAHAVWDAVHFVRARVVPRSLAEACMALDVPLGLGVVLVGLTS
ncbi:hypothetical protein [Micromonospora globbae]|uniref:hypothetical protein n=1 Tax=Micromonospora globbae TaxID=1894969 RepID=UPI0038706351|nr:hypothetical protein OH732_21980 [Micromonospora globbae]